jgi:3-isopropylmalate/(R)-2-methylmalate dehydratase small subunit
MSDTPYARSRVQGRVVPLAGDDIDTDRIIPVRYLRSVTFDGLGAHVFADDREQDRHHSFDDPRFRGARILVSGRNLGGGSSREHAPQALKGWGIRAIVGGSFAEIFFANCTKIGVPCLTIDMADVEWLRAEATKRPSLEAVVDLEASVVRAGGRTIAGTIPDGARGQLLQGTWDATGLLFQAGDAIERVGSSLPYVTGYESPPTPSEGPKRGRR